MTTTAKKEIDLTCFDNTSTIDLVDELGNLQAAIKQYESREAKLVAAIKKRMSEAQQEEFNGAAFTAKYSKVSSTKLDQKKAKAFIETSVDKEFQSEFFTTSTSERLNVSVLPVWAAAAE
mgnify:CR=1 FL=1